jgi:sulfite exporter TauE/SafE
MEYLNGLLLGLSTGIFCFASCVPVYLPQLLAQTDKRRGWTVFAKFNLGRLLAYTAAGAFFGYLGTSRYAQFLTGYSSLVMAVLSLLLIVYGLGLSMPRVSWCAWGRKIQLPFLSGVLVGVNICPPFLLALLHNFRSGDILGGVIFFLMFYAGTTLYLIPPTFLGYFASIAWIRRAGRLAAVIIGLILFAKNIRLFF